MQPVFRFAPSPTGYLHLGHALSALIDFERCQASGGRFLLRIEDIDGTRCRPEFEASIYDDLRWLGIAWEEPVRRQSEHIEDYRAALEKLAAMGVTYPSFMTRAEIDAATRDPAWPRDPDGSPFHPTAERSLDDGERSRRIASGIPFALRLNMERAAALAGPLHWNEDGTGVRETVTADPVAWGDVVIARKETPTSYHLSVVVDDALQGVTHVVRGRDLYAATSVHVLIQKLLGLPTPAYHHHRLILGADGRKFSKSDRSTSLKSLRERGVTAADIRRIVSL